MCFMKFFRNAFSQTKWCKIYDVSLSIFLVKKTYIHKLYLLNNCSKYFSDLNWFPHASSLSKKVGFLQVLRDLYRFDEFFLKLSSLVEFSQITLDLDLVGMLMTSVNCIAVANLSAWNQQLIIYIMDHKMLALTYTQSAQFIICASERQRRDGRPAWLNQFMWRSFGSDNLIAHAVTHSPISCMLFAKIENIAQRYDLCCTSA